MTTRRGRRRCALVAVAGILSAAPATAAAGAGDLDRSFGSQGTRLMPTVSGSDLAVAVDGAGETYMASGARAAVQRLNLDGTTDTTFGRQGVCEQQLHEGVPAAMTVLPDGRIAVVGWADTGTSSAFDQDALVVVCSPQPGDEPRTWTIDNGGLERAYAVAARPDGKLVVAGATTAGFKGDAVVWRVDPDRGLDASFDGDGTAGMDTGGTEIARAVAIRPTDGSIVVAGAVDAQTAGAGSAVVWRLKADGSPANVPNGALDRTFDGDGLAVVDEAESVDWADALGLLPDGRVVIAGGAVRTDPTGSSRVGARVWRLLADGGNGSTNGALDPSFAGDGRATVSPTDHNERIADVALQPDGAVVAVGQGPNGATVWRLRPDGRLDEHFGDAGAVSLGGRAGALDVALRPDRRIVVASMGGAGEAALSRLFGDPYQLTVGRTGAGSGTIVSDPAGLDCPSPCTAHFDVGTPVRLTAVPAPGSVFAGWAGGCEGAGACQVVVDGDRLVQARFEPVAPDGAGAGDPPPPAAFGRRTLVTLKPGRLTRRGRLVVTIRNANRFAVSGRLAATRPRSAGRRFAVPARSAARVTLRLSRTVRRGRAIRIRLRATITDPAGNVRRLSLRRRVRVTL